MPGPFDVRVGVGGASLDEERRDDRRVRPQGLLEVRHVHAGPLLERHSSRRAVKDS